MQKLPSREEAIALLYDKYYEKARCLACTIVKSDSHAEDVVQEAMISVFRKYHQFKGDAALSSWFYRIVYNHALMMRRKEVQFDKHYKLCPEPFELNQDTIDPNFTERIDLEIVLQAVSELPEKCKTWAAHCHKESSEITQTMNMHKSSLFRRRKESRQRLARKFPEYSMVKAA